MRLIILLLFILSMLSARCQSYYLFVGTYTNSGSNTAALPKDSTGSKGIYVYRFDAGTGHATLLSHTKGVVNPSYLATVPGGTVLYACTETRTLHAGSISAFSFDRDSGTLHLINKIPSGGDNPVYVSMHPDGRWVAMANYTGGSLSVFPVGKGGALRTYSVNVMHTGKSVDTARQDRPHIHSAVFSPEGLYLYVQDLGVAGLPVIVSLTFNPTPEMNEASRKAGRMISIVPGGGPRHLEFHPNGKYGYLLEEMGGSVDVYRYHPESGALDSLQRIPTHEPGAKGPFRSADLHVSIDGRFLYASNRESENNITIFSIDPATGLLKRLGYQSALGKEPRNFTLDPSGRWLLVANQESDKIVIFQIDRKTGRLRPTGEILAVPAPTCLKMMP